MAAETKIATTDFGAIEYLDRGAGDPVLVVHGSPGGHDQGSLMADFLVAAGFRAIIPSRPGYFGTELTPASSSIDGTADSQAALMAELGFEKFAVQCWSGGGPSSHRLAIRHPERVTALVALAAVSKKYEWHSSVDERLIFGSAVGNWMLKVMSEHAQKSLVSSTLSAEGDLSKDELKALVSEVWDDEVKRNFVIELAKTVSWRGPRKAGIENDQANFAAIEDLELHRNTVRTLLIHGDVDSDVAPEYSEYAASQIPHAQLEWMPKGGHICVFTNHGCELVQAKIVDFLRA